MNQLRLFYYRLQVKFLDFQIDLASMFVCKGWITSEEYRESFTFYLQRKSLLNTRIQRLGGIS